MTTTLTPLPMNADTFNRFLATAKRKAEAQGIDMTGVTWSPATLDNTWGDLVGVAVHGGTDEANKRTAACFGRLISKYRGPGSYNAQRSVDVEPRPLHGVVQKGGTRLLDGSVTEDRLSFASAGSWRGWDDIEASRKVEAWGVGHTYYPCAE